MQLAQFSGGVLVDGRGRIAHFRGADRPPAAQDLFVHSVENTRA